MDWWSQIGIRAGRQCTILFHTGSRGAGTTIVKVIQMVCLSLLAAIFTQKKEETRGHYTAKMHKAT